LNFCTGIPPNNVFADANCGIGSKCRSGRRLRRRRGVPGKVDAAGGHAAGVGNVDAVGRREAGRATPGRLLLDGGGAGQWDRIDRTADGAEVADYKSSILDGEEDTAQRRAAKNMQLPVYALAYQKTFGELPAKTSLIFLESGQRGEVKPTPDAMGAISAVITSTAAKIRGRQFAADPERPEARTCSQCPYNAICTESWTARQVRGGLS